MHMRLCNLFFRQLDEVRIERWNEFEDNYAFLYSHPEKGSKVLVKVLAIKDKVLVDALSEGSSDPIHLEINVGDYVGENGVANYDSQFKDLRKLVSVVDKEILSKLSGPSTANPSIQYPSLETIEPREIELQGPQPFHPSGVVVPPVYPTVGCSDLLPGPGAGIYPIRFFTAPDFSLLSLMSCTFWSTQFPLVEAFYHLLLIVSTVFQGWFWWHACRTQ
ncbi:unnamed protein product [Ilex paraguariensis]|uniref:PI31 proteasome regulator N-terminal domain-containing protein n=1 Tax=Ilex paraguariensis TaxID=185542 RepID=A0ABC8TSH6_9AQUA